MVDIIVLKTFGLIWNRFGISLKYKAGDGSSAVIKADLIVPWNNPATNHFRNPIHTYQSSPHTTLNPISPSHTTTQPHTTHHLTSPQTLSHHHTPLRSLTPLITSHHRKSYPTITHHYKPHPSHTTSQPYTITNSLPIGPQRRQTDHMCACSSRGREIQFIALLSTRKAPTELLFVCCTTYKGLLASPQVLLLLVSTDRGRRPGRSQGATGKEE
ncbi:hypothetical protein Pmani_039426 [Petrolisthes manimaculis]|uniref:Uncharacterized protein n=1 Tax=Petrolisthes manimaculis TaxID=1843537 RepID=A0AAE1NCM5_9EUCA|nr:hypothetical protein Pmani_039426 [Petrolisthes manimaculis]